MLWLAPLTMKIWVALGQKVLDHDKEHVSGPAWMEGLRHHDCCLLFSSELFVVLSIAASCRLGVALDY